MRVFLIIVIGAAGWLSLRQMQLVQAAEVALAAQAADPDRAVLYVVPDCDPCAAARAALSARGFPFTARDITADAAAFDVYQASGGEGQIPYLVVGAEAFDASDLRALAERLDALGRYRSALCMGLGDENGGEATTAEWGEVPAGNGEPTRRHALRPRRYTLIYRDRGPAPFTIRSISGKLKKVKLE